MGSLPQESWRLLLNVCCRLPTKLREGNVFARVCLFTGLEGVPICLLPMMHWTSLNRHPLYRGSWIRLCEILLERLL